MTGTPNLNITELTTNQTGKTIDINNGFVKLDGATQGQISPAFTSNVRTLTADEFTGNYEILIPTLSATGTLTVPLSKRLFAVNNLGNASHDVVVKGASGATVDVPALSLVELRNDGTGVYAFSAAGVIGGAVTSFNTRTGAVTLAEADIANLDLSSLPTSDPGGGKVWLNGGGGSPASGALWVGPP